MNKRLNQVFTKNRQLMTVPLLACLSFTIPIQGNAAQTGSNATDPKCIQAAQNHLTQIKAIIGNANPFIQQITDGNFSCTWNKESRSITIHPSGNIAPDSNICITCVHKKGCSKCPVGDLH
ncbi:MAG: hypothetical protein JSS53_04940 [Proteobacteria bacterium]|nr:hypothetical protein [Pseudomonadota bacterium]